MIRRLYRLFFVRRFIIDFWRWGICIGWVESKPMDGWLHVEAWPRSTEKVMLVRMADKYVYKTGAFT